MSGLFKKERQVSFDNMDITYAPDGMTLSGHLRAMPGKEGAKMLKDMAKVLNDAAEELESMEEIFIEPPQEIENESPFGKAFD